MHIYVLCRKYSGTGLMTNEAKLVRKVLPVPDNHYQHEYDMEEVVNPLLWVGQAGLNAAFGTTDKLYFRQEKPDVDKGSERYNYTAWRGERVNMQILIWSSDTLEQVRVKLNDLKKKEVEYSGRGFDVNMVRYVIANYPYAVKNAICGVTPYGNGFMMPDRFEPFDRFDLPCQKRKTNMGFGGYSCNNRAGNL